MKRISTAPDRVTSQRTSVPFPKVQKGKDGWEGGREEGKRKRLISRLSAWAANGFKCYQIHRFGVYIGKVK